MRFSPFLFFFALKGVFAFSLTCRGPLRSQSRHMIRSNGQHNNNPLVFSAISTLKMSTEDDTPVVKTIKYNGTIEEWMAEQEEKKKGVEEEPPVTAEVVAPQESFLPFTAADTPPAEVTEKGMFDLNLKDPQDWVTILLSGVIVFQAVNIIQFWGSKLLHPGSS
jgi:hypothetical protein